MSFNQNSITYQILTPATVSANGTVGVITFSGTGALVIPSTVFYNSNTYNVVQVGVFVTPGTVPPSVSPTCTSVTIPSTVTSINDYAFQYNNNLTSLTFASGSKLTTIGENAFSDCTFTSVTIPASVTKIGQSAFSGCNLNYITIQNPFIIPSKVSSIGDYAFSGNPNLSIISFLGNKPSGGTGAIIVSDTPPDENPPLGIYPSGNSSWSGLSPPDYNYRGINMVPGTPAPTPTPRPTPTVFVDLSNFQLNTCPSSIVIDKVEFNVMTASISPFIEGLYYAFYVDGVKVLDNIQTSIFQYTFPIPGCRNVYIVSSTKSTVNRGKSSNPANVVSVCVF